MNQLTKRQQNIVDVITKDGFATVDMLAEKFDVTPQTIRSDINFLCNHDILTRYHGGAAIKNRSRNNVDWRTRQNINFAEKERIAQYIAKNIADDSSLFMNLGTTTEITAQKLLQYKNKLTIITNNLNIAIQLAGKTTLKSLLPVVLCAIPTAALLAKQLLNLFRNFMWITLSSVFPALVMMAYYQILIIKKSKLPKRLYKMRNMLF